MRLSMGFGFLSAKDSYQGQSETISGAGPAMNLAFGGAVMRNLVVFGELAMMSALDPTWKLNGVSRQLDSVTVDLMGIGPGVAYYLENLNMYFSGSLSFSQVTADDNTNSSSDSVDMTDMGLGASLVAGKEWWVSSNWGLGAAAMFRYASMKMADYDTRMSATGISVLFSATYN
jgi:hypothetical protein